MQGAPEHYLLYDLRALCLLHASQAQGALDDAMQCTKLRPDWWVVGKARALVDPHVAVGWARLLPPPLPPSSLPPPTPQSALGPTSGSAAGAMVLCRARGWARLGAAQLGLGHYQAALAAYKKGLRLQPGAPDMELGLQEAGELAQSRGGRRDAVHHE